MLEWLPGIIPGVLVPGETQMSLVLLIGLPVLFVWLMGAGWLLWQMLQQQGRLLLRLETVEARQDAASPAYPAKTAEPRQYVPMWTPAVLADSEIPATRAEGRIELTIGMATYNDYEGVYFTLQALRLYQDLSQTELLVIDNYGCPHTQRLVEEIPGARYIRATEVVGTAAPRELLFKEARGNAVLCCDCHVLLAPGIIARLKQFYREHPACADLLQGPMLYDDGQRMATHMNPVWRNQMWGKWDTDPRGQDADGEPFEIPMHGLGVFSCLKRAWPGFHPQFRGYGGEEGYIHEKFRQTGRRCLCLPWLRWMHRFSRPGRVISPLMGEERLRNYVLGHTELGLDLAPVLNHFSHYLPEERVRDIAEQAIGSSLTGLGPLGVTDFPLVSVVMPVYNGERYLRAAVQSLLSQTLQPIEIIIINDGSTDQTEQILDELAADPRVKPVHQPHLGIPHARNSGIALAKAKYIAVHDADDLSVLDRLAKQYAFLEQFPDVALVGSLANVVNETGHLIGRFGGVPTDPQQITETLLTRNCLVHGAVLMRTAAVEAVGRYREAFALAHDYDLWLRMAEHFEMRNLAEVLYLRRSHPESVSHTHRQVQRAYASIAQELAEERRQTGSDLLEREGLTAFLNVYGARLQEAGLPAASKASSRLEVAQPALTFPLVNGQGETFQLPAPSPRQKVFGIGLSRTGTTSLTEALELLGYRTVHGPADPVTQLELYQFFASASERVYLSVLQNHDALTDALVCCLYRALDKAYPGSKFILTIREKQAWLRSYQDLWEVSDRFSGPGSYTTLAYYTRFINKILYSHPGRQEATAEILSPAYDRYTTEVLDYFRGRPHDLLILDVCGGEGWSTLAPFLGVPIPAVPFPWKNRALNQEEANEEKRETSNATQWQLQEAWSGIRM